MVSYLDKTNLEESRFNVCLTSRSLQSRLRGELEGNLARETLPVPNGPLMTDLWTACRSTSDDMDVTDRNRCRNESRV